MEQKKQAFQPYLDFLISLKTDLGELTDLMRQETLAIEKKERPALEDILHQQQAIYLSLRGHNQRQKKLLQDADFADVPLADLAMYYPEEMQPEVRQTTAALLQLYQKYQTQSAHAHLALDVNLEWIEKIYEKQMELGNEPSALQKHIQTHSIDRRA